MIRAWGLLLSAALVACGPTNETSESPPAPAPLGDDAIGYYCQMNLTEHEGPKAQIFVKGKSEPLWFSQARDGVVFTRLPEETAEVTAFYVTDMSDEASWKNTENLTWVAAEEAFFVIDSKRAGGMGAPEAVPFGKRDDAERYQSDYGGRIVSLDEIPDDYVLAPVLELNAHDGDHH